MAINGYERPSLITLRLNNPDPELVLTHILKVLDLLCIELDDGITVTAIRFRRLPISK